MTNIEDRIQALDAKAAKSAELFINKKSELKKKLKNCTHKYVADYQWEHDNGYGRQSWINGKRCLSCDKLSPWADDTWHHRNNY